MRIAVALSILLGSASVHADAKQKTGPCAGYTLDECMKAATNYENGTNGFKVNKPRALAMYKAGCDAKVPHSCTWAAELATGDERRKLFERGCTDADPVGCSLFASELEHSDDAADASAARALRIKLCNRKDGGSCRVLGDKTSGGGALQWYRKGCAAGHDDSCGSAARMLFNDRDPDSTPVQATKALEVMCEQGVASACDFASMRHFQGKGAKASRANSLVWWRKGCEVAKDVEQCRRYGLWYLHDGKTANDLATAIEFLDRACKGGSKDSCDDVARARKMRPK